MLIRTLGTVLWGILLGGVASACDLKIESPWIRQPPPGATTLGAYATLRNTGARMMEISDISSAAAGMVMLHQTTMVGGIARMRSVEVLKIPAGGKVVLAPNGMHVMLMDLGVLPKAGDHLSIAFKDASGCATSAEFVVRPMDAEGPSGTDHSGASADMKGMPGM